MEDGSVDVIRLRREVLPLPVVVEERLESGRPEPEHGAQRGDDLLVSIERDTQIQLFLKEHLRAIEVRPPAV